MTSAQPKLAAEVVAQRGPWPFVTRRVFRMADGRERLWSSREHRKGLLIRAAAPGATLGLGLLRRLWAPGQLNWWIGVLFAMGSLLFALASLLSLAPSLANAWSLDSTRVNAIFFIGSIPFTFAAYLQLFQAANAGEFHPTGASSRSRLTLFGFKPKDIGWLSCALQFVGTILFNFNTGDAMTPSLGWIQQDKYVWAPNMVGSILFLVSGYLAFVETCHAHWAWRPRSLSWWVVFTSLLGCISFMIAALFAVALPITPSEWTTISIVFTLVGAICFLIGSLLMLPETVAEEEAQTTSSSAH